MSPLNRSQYLQGDTSEGPVLSGKVQGVKAGSGTKILPDGSIIVDASTAQGLVKTNNQSAYNEYVWPAELENLRALFTDEEGNLSWEYPNISSCVVVSPTAPESPPIGQLWYNTSTKKTLLFENSEGGNQWTECDRGQDADVNNVSAEPAFVSGTGGFIIDGGVEELDPFVLQSSVTQPGTVISFEGTITVIGLTPYQHLPIVDIDAESNGYRFSVTNTQADENGVLSFKPLFHDFPVSDSASAYVATFRIGFSGVYVRAAVEITSPLSVADAGTIIGVPSVGKPLTYEVGYASGGTPPYTYSWVWRAASSSFVVQNGGDLLQVPPSLVGDQVYVELTAKDAKNNIATLATAFYPPPPETISKGPFPNTDILYPSFSNETAQTVWKDEDTSIYATGCVEFTLDDITWGQQVRNISNGDVIKTRWLEAGCLDKPSGFLIEGCVESSSYRDCGSLLIDKLPSPFSFTPKKDVKLNAEVVSNIITPSGYNSKSYVSYSGSSTALDIQASVDGGNSWASLPLIGQDTFPINPGETLTLKVVSGDRTETDYEAKINIGQGTFVQSGSFLVTTAKVTTFSTLIPFPVTTYQGYDAEAAPSVAWSGGDGSMNIQASGCIQFRVNGGSWTQSSTAITTGNTLETRWISSAGCGQAPHGTLISGTITDGGTRTIDGSLIIDTVPTDFSFQNKVNQGISSVVESNTISLAGFNATAYVSYSSAGTNLTNLEISVNSGAWNPLPVLGSSSVVVQPTIPGAIQRTIKIRGTTGGANNTNYTVRINAGNTSSAINSTTWTVKTTEVVKTISQPSISSPINGATNLNPNSASPSGITIISSSYVPLNGTGGHLSTSWEVRKGSTGGTTITALNEDTNNLTSLVLPLVTLDVNSSYYVRVKYHSSDSVASAWSNWSKFTTATTFNLSWVKRWASSSASGLIPERLVRFENIPSLADPSPIGLFIGVGGIRGSIITSRDGKIWNFTRTVFDEWDDGQQDDDGENMRAIGFDGTNLYVAGSGGLFYKSTNGGSSWSEINTSGATTATCRGMAWGAGVMVSVHSSGIIQTSTNGCQTWTLRNSGTGVQLEDVIFADGIFYAVGGNKILTSNNGVNWSIVDVGSSPDGRSLYRIAHLNGKFVAVRNESTQILTSSNGTSWTAITTPNRFQFIAAGGIWFVGGGSYSSSKFSVWSSSDFGVTWQKDYQDDAEIHCHGVAHSPTLGRWAALGHNYTAYSTN